jgi:FixJ family two-component response regulator
MQASLGMARAASPTSVHRHVVIVVDDDVNVRRLYHDTLDAAGMRTHVTANGEEGLRLAQAYRDACLLLADVRMPGMDGWDLERELRRVTPDLPVVLVTADRLLSIRGTVRDKPISADDIAALVRTSCMHADRPNRQADDPAPSDRDR